jgi:glycosyltransferase involved in cell wall biosynthesis
VAVSEDIRGALLRAGAAPGRVRTVLNGIDPSLFRRDRTRQSQARLAFGPGPAEIVIGAVGRLEHQKRFDLLLEAVALLRMERPQFGVVIAGDGSLRQNLQAHADRLGLGASCRFLGHTSDVTGAHHAFDVFVQSSEYEGTPNAVLEAMALETPIVATSAGGTREVMQDKVHGLLVPSGDPRPLAEAIARTLADPSATAHRVAAARARIEGELSFATRMETLHGIYEDLVRARHSRAGQAEAWRWA